MISENNEINLEDVYHVDDCLPAPHPQVHDE